jgi:NitT/TauT family transport system substrate-binding protein
MRTSLAGMGTALALVAGLALSSPALAQSKMRIAFGDIASVESLHLLVALERAKEKGLAVELTTFKSEDLAAQAVVGGQADVGIGGPYALMQKVKAPVRIFFQLSKLRFYPVVNSASYKTWKDLDGQEVAVHSRGSGTEAIMRLMADKQGIKYKTISYIPGSEVRAGALLQGTVKASIVGAPEKRMLEEKAPGKFIFLSTGEVSASDDTLFATTDYLKANAASVDILVEALLQTWNDVAKNPGVVAEWRAKYKLLPDLPANMASGITPYFTEIAASKALPVDGGNVAGVKDDLTFYSLAGQLQGDPASLKVEDFWDVGAIDRAVAKLGKK